MKTGLDENPPAKKLVENHDFISSSKADWVPNLMKYVQQGYSNPDMLSQLNFGLQYRNFRRERRFYLIIKTLIDPALGLFLLLLCAPLFLIIGALIKLDSRGSIFYCQERSGLGFRIFKIYKFRTMVVDAHRRISFIDEVRRPLYKADERDWRVTKVGYFLRKWKLDELPQLINIALGDMSVVGPRPLSVDDSATIQNKYWLRFVCKPGLTGLWQCQYPVVRSSDTKLKLDCKYVEQCGLVTDWKIILRTFKVIAKGEF